MTAPYLYTVGHSNLTVPAFLSLLQEKAVQVVVDVRSAPYSRYVPHFNKDALEPVIRSADLKYLFMGREIGGKPTDPELLDEHGAVLYEKIAASKTFDDGINRLLRGVADWTIALMCAEEDPLSCHRHHLIARELECNRNIAVWHLRANGSMLRAADNFAPASSQLKLF